MGIMYSCSKCGSAYSAAQHARCLPGSHLCYACQQFEAQAKAQGLPVIAEKEVKGETIRGEPEPGSIEA